MSVPQCCPLWDATPMLSGTSSRWRAGCAGNTWGGNHSTQGSTAWGTPGGEIFPRGSWQGKRRTGTFVNCHFNYSPPSPVCEPHLMGGPGHRTGGKSSPLNLLNAQESPSCPASPKGSCLQDGFSLVPCSASTLRCHLCPLTKDECHDWSWLRGPGRPQQEA